MGVVYLIHFDEPYKHARHYMGYTRNGGLDQRIAMHRKGYGARLLEVVNSAGIGWQVARTWENATRGDERRMKGRGLAPLCPLCKTTERSER